MIKFIDNPDDPTILNFILFLERQFEFKYPVRIFFKLKWRKKSAGEYHRLGKYIEVLLDQPSKDHILSTIAHEIRHAYQHMYDTDIWKSTCRKREHDAEQWAKQKLMEFKAFNQFYTMENSQNG